MKVWLAWSSGKDSAWTLHVLRRQGQVEVAGLLTTVNETHDRVAMHAVRRRLLEAQAGGGLSRNTLDRAENVPGRRRRHLRWLPLR